MQEEALIGGHYALGSWLGVGLHCTGKRKEEDASCQWGRRGEIPEATCLDKRCVRNTGPDFPTAPLQGKGLGQEGWGWGLRRTS